MTRKNKQPFEALPITEASTAYRTDRWLKSVHITPKFLSDTDIATEFLQAQREAETLLRNFPEHLSRSQSYQLVDFLRRLGNRKQRRRMNISRAYVVLNIAAKINRQCFREYRALNKQDKPLANKG
jgi:antibiotic biosynthesis monooxygenase (ABM) superfamily enzyme